MAPHLQVAAKTCFILVRNEGLDIYTLTSLSSAQYFAWAIEAWLKQPPCDEPWYPAGSTRS